MANNVYKHIEITGTSSTGVEDAVSAAVKKASGSVRNMRWFEVTDLRGHIDGGSVEQWQVTVKIGFTLDD